MNNRELAEQVRAIASPIVASLGFELIETEYLNEQGRWVLRLYIDSTEGSVKLGDCEKVSWTISSMLDVEDILPGKYNLEVSSPGLERPIRRESDFKKFTGKTVKVRTETKIGDRRNFKGIIKGVDSGIVTLVEEDRISEIPIVNIIKARLQNES